MPAATCNIQNWGLIGYYLYCVHPSKSTNEFHGFLTFRSGFKAAIYNNYK